MWGRPRGRATAGFTLIELVVVLVLLGILSVVVLPKFGTSTTYQASSFYDQVRAALQYAQKTAVSHRRLVCATLTNTSVTLTIASATAATSCPTTLLPPPGGGSVFATSPNAATVTVTPAAVVYFQPSGQVSSDAPGASISNFSFTVTGMTAISVQGTTGYVN